MDASFNPNMLSKNDHLIIIGLQSARLELTVIGTVNGRFSSHRRIFVKALGGTSTIVSGEARFGPKPYQHQFLTHREEIIFGVLSQTGLVPLGTIMVTACYYNGVAVIND